MNLLKSLVDVLAMIYVAVIESLRVIVRLITVISGK